MEYSIGMQCLCFPLLISVNMVTKVIVLKYKDIFWGLHEETARKYKFRQKFLQSCYIHIFYAN